MKSPLARGQRGGFILGMVVGLLIGLAVALGVALYVTKAPVPFVNKVPARPPGQEAAEAERNRNWDPNSALAGKNPAPIPASATAAPPGVLPPTATATPGVDPASAARPTRPVASASAPTVAAASAPATRASQAAVAGGDPFTYYVQAGAFARTEDAEQQRARLAMIGVQSRLTEREQGGRTVYRVRVGPFDKKEEADAAKEKLGDAGVDSALVRVQR